MTNEHNQCNIGRLWHCADSAQEAAEWARGFLERGAVSVMCKARRGEKQVDVIIAIRRDETANTVAGYEVEESEWLEPIARAQIRELCREIQRGYAAGKCGMDAGMIDRILELTDHADDIAILAQEE